MEDSMSINNSEVYSSEGWRESPWTAHENPEKIYYKGVEMDFVRVPTGVKNYEEYLLEKQTISN